MDTCCDKCGKVLALGEFPFCPHGFGANSAVDDTMDLWVRHGLCHEDGSPKHFTSRTQWQREQRERGIVNRVEHIPNPHSGSDRSKHTSRWV